MWPFDRRNKEKEFVQSLGKRYPHTPDMAQLETGPHTILFACDDLMTPHVNNKLLNNRSHKIGRGFTKDKFDYRIGRHTGRGLPFMNHNGLRVKGELHLVETGLVPALDKHYDNGVQFARVKVRIITTDRWHRMIPIGSEERIKNLPRGVIRTVPELGIRHYTSNPMVCFVTAHMYVALKQYWLDDEKSWPLISPTFPETELIWLRSYYKYPIERNRCLKPPR